MCTVKGTRTHVCACVLLHLYRNVIGYKMCEYLILFVWARYVLFASVYMDVFLGCTICLFTCAFVYLPVAHHEAPGSSTLLLFYSLSLSLSLSLPLSLSLISDYSVTYQDHLTASLRPTYRKPQQPETHVGQEEQEAVLSNVIPLSLFLFLVLPIKAIMTS